MHPIGGIDHILAMVAVGVFAFVLGGRALYLVPLAFVGMMAADRVHEAMDQAMSIADPGMGKGGRRNESETEAEGQFEAHRFSFAGPTVPQCGCVARRPVSWLRISMLAPPSQSQTSGTLEELSVTVAGAAQGVRLLPVSREGFAALRAPSCHSCVRNVDRDQCALHAFAA
jgi:hypothetical protein